MDFQHGSDSGDKASMAQGQSNPPPYQDVPQMGYPLPGPAQFGGYPPQPYPGHQPYPMPGQTVIAVQPVAGVPLSPPENDYLGYSIFTLLCCCWPLGIAALVYSIIAREANARGDRVEAARGSRLARTLNHTALGFGITIITIAIIYVVVVLTQFS